MAANKYAFLNPVAVKQLVSQNNRSRGLGRNRARRTDCSFYALSYAIYTIYKSFKSQMNKPSWRVTVCDEKLIINSDDFIVPEDKSNTQTIFFNTFRQEFLDAVSLFFEVDRSNIKLVELIFGEGKVFGDTIISITLMDNTVIGNESLSMIFKRIKRGFGTIEFSNDPRDDLV